MRIVLLALCAAYLAADTCAHVSPVSDSFKACLAESGMTRDDFIQALKSTDTTKAQCIAACTMEKERFMSDENINVDAIIAKMEDVSQEIGKTQITHLVKACAAEGNEFLYFYAQAYAKETTEGKCGIAHSVVRCIHDELRQEGWI